ncbi:MAG: hypothetical protein LC768_15640 [Acidobacteria bacterium]|nr:hypothetical protein [Acidobacteriota bacterium]MCA1639732.1 hypothetical protein [Acidobacteriota bacterium]
MKITFAGVVEEVKQLSFDEKRELKDLLETYLIEERRQEILENGEQTKQELKKGELKFSSNTDELMEMLDD